MFHDEKYHRIGKVTPSLLEKVLKFNNYTIDKFNYVCRWINIYIYIYIYTHILSFTFKNKKSKS